MIFIDASFFLAYDNENDVHHSRALAILDDIEKYGPVFTSDYILNEVVGVGLRKLGKERAVTLGQHILKTTFIINVDEHIFSESWGAFSKTDLNLSLVDCTTLVIMKLANAGKIATFDKEFRKINYLDVLE
ncbi:MAG: type II toxin-antitoxin system VapC family toxin [Candidatus Aenigmarchaeota archaeon]|nr:type II toxin-antitoxin system VapC family toxin [Candidatus Aenigmarchaeota archaeon]